MQTITEKINDKLLPYIKILEDFYPDKRIMMFDIETTGLSPDRSFTYIIGMNMKIDNEWHIVLLFNDDGRSEPEMINVFQEELSKHDILVEFNGDTFDINYIKRRMTFIKNKLGLSIPDNFGKVQTVDLMKLVRPYKFALGLPNIKQKTIERYLGVDREDKFNGGQLIDVYLNYLMDKSSYSKKLVLQHNRDDMEGMLYLSRLYSIEAVNAGCFDVSSMETESKNNTLYLIFKINLKYELPQSIFASSSGISFSGEGKCAALKAPVSKNRLKFFFGSSRDSFDEKEGLFISQLGGEVKNVPAYKNLLKDKISYVEICDSFLGNSGYVKEYVKKTAGLILKNGK